VELQWQMMEANERMAELLESETVDADAALEQVDRMLDLERSVKRLHLRQLSEIKNALTAEQQQMLRQLQEKMHEMGALHREGPDGRMHREGHAAGLHHSGQPPAR
jgi:Spy/CpxP family protein refolding chaperone